VAPVVAGSIPVIHPIKFEEEERDTMNLSSRWCVTAVVALAALGCSDPVPPPAQGAFIARITSVSPAPAGKSCPSGAAFTYDVPDVPAEAPTEELSPSTYLHKIIDGEANSAVSCRVTGGGASFEGRIAFLGKSIEITNGTLGADSKGTARIAVGNSQQLSGTLVSPMANCKIDAKPAGNNLQVDAGHIWATFDCPSVESEPSDYCRATGTFVLENCDK
jgi:hypothetical protein